MHRRAIVPARVNIIGEHVDNHGGLSLPFTTSECLVMDAIQREEGYSGDELVIRLWKEAGGWPADLTVKSRIPIGKGMSSSAALCVAVVLCAKGVNEGIETCREARRIERAVLGNDCGLLDQIAMIFSKKGHAVLVDFSDLSMEQVPLPASWIFKLVDSGISRNLSSTDYGKRNAYSEEHVVNEVRRVLDSRGASAEHLGRLLNESHSSLISLGVSLAEIDRMIDGLQQMDGVLGARMMGGGFGGMILVLVENEEVLPSIPVVVSSGSAHLEEVL